MKFLNQFFYNFFYKYFYNFFFIYIKISKTLSAKYYQENKEWLHKKLAEDIKVFLKKKIWSRQYGHDVTKISQKMKSKSLSSIEKNDIEGEKTLPYNLKT